MKLYELDRVARRVPKADALFLRDVADKSQ
jgi:hypothetical protein